MISHVFIGVSDFDRALAFYRQVMGALGMPERYCERDRPWAGWQTPGTGRPLFLIGRPYDGLPHQAGNGQMIALNAADRATVDQVYRVAMSSGATSEGEPALRPHYHANYYGAYFRDPDGNKLCVVCHAAAEVLDDPLT